MTISKHSALLALALTFGLWMINGGCQKDDLNPNYPFKVVVKTLADSLRVPNVDVTVLAPIPENVVYFKKTTNIEGEVHFEYDRNAILLIRASRGKRPDYEWIGCSEIRLKANETVSQTVYIRPYDPEVEGC